MNRQDAEDAKRRLDSLAIVASWRFVFVYFGLALLIPFARGRAGTTAERPARVGVVLAAVGLVADVLWLVQAFGGKMPLLEVPAFSMVISIAAYGAAVALQVYFWVALTRSPAPRPGWSAAFHGLVAVSVTLWVMRIALPFPLYRELFIGTALGTTLSVVRFLVTTGAIAYGGFRLVRGLVRSPRG